MDGEVLSVVLEGASPAASSREFIGTSRETPGAALSGFAMRKPPNDCDRLKSFSMAGFVASGSP